jgi:hypothetical protein
VDEFGMKVFEFGGYVNMLHPILPQGSGISRPREGFETAELSKAPWSGTISAPAIRTLTASIRILTLTIEAWRLLSTVSNRVLKDTSGSMVVLGMEAQVTTISRGEGASQALKIVGDERCAVNLDRSTWCRSAGIITDRSDQRVLRPVGEQIYGCHAKDSYLLSDKQPVQIKEVCPGAECWITKLICPHERMKWPRADTSRTPAGRQYAEAAPTSGAWRNESA